MMQFRSTAVLFGFISIILLLIPKICCGIDISDSPYHLVNQSLALQDLKTAYRIAPAWWLSDWQGSLLLHFFGDGYLSQKILGAALVAFSIGLTAFHFRACFHQTLAFLAVCIYSILYMQPHPLLPDYYTIPAFWMTLYAIAFLNMLKAPGAAKSILGGVILTVCIFSRLPAASLLIVPCICLLFVDRRSKKCIILQLGCCVASSVLVLLVLHHQGMLSIWHEGLTQKGTNEFSNTAVIIKRYVYTAAENLIHHPGDIALFILAALIVFPPSHCSSHPRRKSVYLVSVLSLLIVPLYIDGLTAYFCSLILIGILLYRNMKHGIRLDQTDRAALIFAAVLPFCLAFGSNSGMYRVYHLVYFPVIACGALLQKYSCSREKPLSLSRQFLAGGTAVIAVLLFIMFQPVFRDAPMRKCAQPVRDGKFSHVHAGPDTYGFLQDCEEHLPTIIGTSDFYAYPNASVYYYMLSKNPPRDICWDSIMGRRERERHLDAILSSPPRFIIRNYQFDYIAGFTADPAETDQKIRQSRQYTPIYQSKHYAIYERTGQ